MIGKLVYKLPEDGSEFRLAQNAWKYKSTLIDISNILRAKCKYSEGDEDKPPQTWDELREAFYRVLSEAECPDVNSDD